MSRLWLLELMFFVFCRVVTAAGGTVGIAIPKCAAMTIFCQLIMRVLPNMLKVTIVVHLVMMLLGVWMASYTAIIELHTFTSRTIVKQITTILLQSELSIELRVVVRVSHRTRWSFQAVALRCTVMSRFTMVLLHFVRIVLAYTHCISKCCYYTRVRRH